MRSEGWGEGAMRGASVPLVGAGGALLLLDSQCALKVGRSDLSDLAFWPRRKPQHSVGRAAQWPPPCLQRWTHELWICPAGYVCYWPPPTARDRWRYVSVLLLELRPLIDHGKRALSPISNFDESTLPLPTGNVSAKGPRVLVSLMCFGVT